MDKADQIKHDASNRDHSQQSPNVNQFLLLRSWNMITGSSAGNALVARLQKRAKIDVVSDDRFKEFNDLHCLVNLNKNMWVASGVILGKYSQGLIDAENGQVTPLCKKALHPYGIVTWKTIVALFNCNEKAVLLEIDGTNHVELLESKFYFKSRQAINGAHPQVLKPRVSKGYCIYNQHAYFMTRLGPVVYWNLDHTRSHAQETVAIALTDTSDIAVNKCGLYVKKADGTVWMYRRLSDNTWHAKYKYDVKHPALEGKDGGETRNNIAGFPSGKIVTEHYITNTKIDLIILSQKLVKLDSKTLASDNLQPTHLKPIKVRSFEYCISVYAKQRFDIFLVSRRLHLLHSHSSPQTEDSKLHYGIWAKDCDFIIYGIGKYIHYKLTL